MTDRKAVRALSRHFDHFLSWLYTRRLYGQRCPDFAEHCPCCEAWQAHDEIFNGALARPATGEGQNE